MGPRSSWRIPPWLICAASLPGSCHLYLNILNACSCAISCWATTSDAFINIKSKSILLHSITFIVCHNLLWWCPLFGILSSSCDPQLPKAWRVRNPSTPEALSCHAPYVGALVVLLLLELSLGSDIIQLTIGLFWLVPGAMLMLYEYSCFLNCVSSDRKSVV